MIKKYYAASVAGMSSIYIVVKTFKNEEDVQNADLYHILTGHPMLSDDPLSYNFVASEISEEEYNEFQKSDTIGTVTWFDNSEC